MKKIILFLLLCIVALATGCPKLVKTKPSTKFDQNKLVTQTNSYLSNQQMAYYCVLDKKKVEYDYTNLKYLCRSDAVTNGNETAKRIRNEAIENGIMAVNSVYTDFVDALNTGRATSNFIADIIDLGTGATIGISKGERSLQVLGVTLTAFRGGRKSADLNFFREQTTPILINKMDDNRSTQYASILLKKDKSADEYPMQEAIRDIVDYYNAGTLIKAFTQLSKDTGEKANQSEKRVLSLKNINPEDILIIPTDVIDAGKKYVDFRNQFNNRLHASTSTQDQKDDATEKLRLIYVDIFNNKDFAPVLEKVKNNSVTLAADMKKLEDETQGQLVAGDQTFLILRQIYKSLDPNADSKLIVKFVQSFEKHPVKK